MYESPISIVYRRIEQETNDAIENAVYKAVLETGVGVDKHELTRALAYDRDQYNKGYADGEADAAPKWISAKDKLPDQNGDYLIHYRFKKQSKGKGFYSVCFYERTCEKPHFHNEGYCGMYVTHWMSLPEPPKEG